MDLATNGVVITDAIKFVQTNKEKLTSNKREIKNLKNQTMMIIKISYKKKQEATIGEQETTNRVFDIDLLVRLHYFTDKKERSSSSSLVLSSPSSITLSSGLVVVAFNDISTNSGRLAGEF